MQETHVHLGMLSSFNPMVHFANKLDASPGQTWGPRTISDFQLLYVLSGNGTIQLGNETIHLHTGECVFYGMESPHMLIASELDPFSFMSIHFEWNTQKTVPTHPVHGIKDCTLADLQQPAPTFLLNVEPYREIVFPNHIIAPPIDHLFSQIVREYRFEEPGYVFTLKGLLIQLLSAIIRHVAEGTYSTGERRKIAPALEAIRKQPEIQWSLRELAEVCGYHPTYFSNIFKETMGFTPKQFIIQERIRKAKQLLLEEKTIEEVALKLGYTSIHYFSRNFKASTGLTPTEYKFQSLEL